MESGAYAELGPYEQKIARPGYISMTSYYK